MQKLTADEVWEDYLRKVNLEHRGGVLREYLRILGLFRRFLGADHPTTEKAREYLQRFTQRSRNTQARYTDIINGILDWCREEKVNRVRTPKHQPRYIPESEFDTFFATISAKKTHKATIARDILMFELQDAAGMRCAEIHALIVNDLFLDGRHQREPYLIAHGKGDKDRPIPLTIEMAEQLRSFVKGKRPDESVFGLKAKTIVNKFGTWRQKAGVSLTAHDLRRHFATDLNDLGVRLTTTQQLMGHSDISTTQRYMAVPPKSARQAIELRARRRNGVAERGLSRTSSPFPGDPAATSRDPWVAALEVMLDPANLIEALKPGGAEDVQFDRLSATVVPKVLRGASPEET